MPFLNMRVASYQRPLFASFQLDMLNSQTLKSSNMLRCAPDHHLQSVAITLLRLQSRLHIDIHKSRSKNAGSASIPSQFHHHYKLPGHNIAYSSHHKILKLNPPSMTSRWHPVHGSTVQTPQIEFV